MRHFLFDVAGDSRQLVEVVAPVLGNGVRVGQVGFVQCINVGGVAAERRVVHQTLAADPEVETVSEGEGPWRKVVIRPRVKR